MIAGLNLAYLQRQRLGEIGERGSPDSEVVPKTCFLLGALWRKDFEINLVVE